MTVALEPAVWRTLSDAAADCGVSLDDMLTLLLRGVPPEEGAKVLDSFIQDHYAAELAHNRRRDPTGME